MTTTIDSLVQYPAKAHHRAVAFGIAALLLVGGAIGTTAVLAADNDSGAKAPTEATTSNGTPAQDTLVSRYGQQPSQPFADQPKLNVSGAR
jgi:hypothetical protein